MNATRRGARAVCQTDTSDKNPAFQKVQDGTTVPGIGPQKVVLWTGDNINDFPNESQAGRTDESGLADFGSRFVVLPNPMYGSWQDRFYLQCGVHVAVTQPSRAAAALLHLASFA
jgi:predicted secreted acid phosphatase